MSPRLPPAGTADRRGPERPDHVPLPGGVRGRGGLPFRVDEGGRGPHGFLEIRDEGGRLVLDLHQPCRILRDFLGHRGDRRDVLAREPDQLCVRPPDGLHALELLGLGHVDPDDLASGDRRADHLGPEHAGQADVVRVFRLAGYL